MANIFGTQSPIFGNQIVAGDDPLMRLYRQQTIMQMLANAGSAMAQVNNSPQGGNPWAAGLSAAGEAASSGGLSPLEMLKYQEVQARAEERERQAADRERRAAAVRGPYSPEAGGVPWKNPDYGQMLPAEISTAAKGGRTLTGGIFDTMPLEPHQRRLLDAATPDEAFGMASEMAFADPAKYTTSNTVEVEGPDGRPVRVPMKQAVEGATPVYEPAPKQTQRDKDVTALLERGFSQNDANDIAAGRLTVTSPDQFGNVHLVNRATGATRVAIQGGGQAAAQPPAAVASQSAQIPRATPSAEEAARGGTGPWSYLGAALNAVVGGVFSTDLFPDTQANRQHLRTLNQVVKVAFINNPKIPVAEQKTVQGFLANPDDFWGSPVTNSKNMADLRDFMVRKRMSNEGSLQNATITTEERGRLANQNAEIDRILGLMGSESSSQAEQPIALPGVGGAVQTPGGGTLRRVQ